MSDEDFPPSHFLEQPDDGCDNSLVDGLWMADDFDAVLDYSQYLEYPDESANHEEDFVLAEPRSQGQLQQGVPGLVDQEVSTHPHTPPASGSLEGDRPKESHQPQETHNGLVLGEDLREVSSTHITTPQHNSSNYDQQVCSAIEQQLESPKTRIDQKGATSNQSIASPNDASNFDTEKHQVSLRNGDCPSRPSNEWLLAHNDFASLQQGGDLADVDFNIIDSQEWNDFDDPPANEDDSAHLGLEEQEYEQNPGQADPVVHDGTQILTEQQLDNLQQQEGLVECQQGLEFKWDVFASEGRKDSMTQPGNEDIPALLGLKEQIDEQTPNQPETVVHNGTQAWTEQNIHPLDLEPWFDDGVQDYDNPNQYPGISSVRPAINTPGSSSMAGSSGDTNPNANLPSNDSHAAVNDAKLPNIDKEPEEENVTLQVPSETYEENDPQIIKNPIQKGWGRTGKRNGQEVWFNEETGKWRKSQLPHSKSHQAN